MTCWQSRRQNMITEHAGGQYSFVYSWFMLQHVCQLDILFIKITLAYITNEIDVIPAQNDTEWGDAFIIHNHMWMTSSWMCFRLPFQAAGSVQNHIILIFTSICHQRAEVGCIEFQFFIQWNAILYTTRQWQRKDMMRLYKGTKIFSEKCFYVHGLLKKITK